MMWSIALSIVVMATSAIPCSAFVLRPPPHARALSRHAYSKAESVMADAPDEEEVAPPSRYALALIPDEAEHEISRRRFISATAIGGGGLGAALLEPAMADAATSASSSETIMKELNKTLAADQVSA